ncbi:hypothetical protein ACIO3R_24960 [Streptomyces sp. NPDC087428]|uniref:hypothetical protein n=1 Tax=Streptomyces sp. NPDC087428 TaxID=3365788 RepID=UPI00380258D9
MSDLIGNLAGEGGRVLVGALAAGLVDAVKKIPTLWRREGTAAEERMEVELHRSAGELAASQEGDSGEVRARTAIVWETRLRDLLATYPEAGAELTEILAEMQREHSIRPSAVQHVTASGRQSQAQGVIGGSIYNYGSTRLDSPAGHAQDKDDVDPGDRDNGQSA